MQRRFPWQHQDVYGKIQKEKKCEGPESKDFAWKTMGDAGEHRVVAKLGGQRWSQVLFLSYELGKQEWGRS